MSHVFHWLSVLSSHPALLCSAMSPRVLHCSVVTGHQSGQCRQGDMIRTQAEVTMRIIIRHTLDSTVLLFQIADR